jgi:hypothetical protein
MSSDLPEKKSMKNFQSYSKTTILIRDIKRIPLCIRASPVRYAGYPPFVVLDISALFAQSQICVSFASFKILQDTLSSITSLKSRHLQWTINHLFLMIFFQMRFLKRKKRLFSTHSKMLIKRPWKNIEKMQIWK